MSESIPGFFGGTGGNPYWPKGPNTDKPTPDGETIEGIIAAVHPPEPQTDFNSGQPIPGKFQVRIDLQTELRDPGVDGDEGMRTLYVKGWMTGAINDALRQVNVKEPQVGAKLAITLKGRNAPLRAGILGAQTFSATYEPSGGFFAAPANGASAASKDAPVPDAPPAGIDPAAWKEMPATAKQAIANVSAGLG